MNIEQDNEGLEPEEDAKIEIFRPYVDLVLYAFGFSPDEALWVNDASVIADIMPGDEDLPDAIESLGFKFTERDYVWEVAAFLKKTGEE